jgi:hypothetical protein
VEYPPLSHVEAAKRLKPMVEAAGGSWTGERFQWLAQRFPGGVPQDQFDGLVAELTGPAQGMKKPLRIVAA